MAYRIPIVGHANCERVHAVRDVITARRIHIRNGGYVSSNPAKIIKGIHQGIQDIQGVQGIPVGLNNVGYNK